MQGMEGRLSSSEASQGTELAQPEEVHEPESPGVGKQL